MAYQDLREYLGRARQAGQRAGSGHTRGGGEEEPGLAG